MMSTKVTYVFFKKASPSQNILMFSLVIVKYQFKLFYHYID